MRTLNIQEMAMVSGAGNNADKSSGSRKVQQLLHATIATLIVISVASVAGK